MRCAAVLLLVAMAAGSAIGASQTIQYAGGTIHLNAGSIAGFSVPNTEAIDRIVLTERARIKLVAKSGVVMETNSTDATIRFAAPVTKMGGKTPTQDLKAVDFVGPVKMTYTKPKEVIDQSGQAAKIVTRMDAAADSADYDGVKQMAYLRGHATVTMTDPTMYEVPAVATGDLIEVNTKPNLTPDEMAFRISTPGGASHLEAAPVAGGGGAIESSASEIKGFGSTRLVLTGDAYVKSTDKTTGGVFQARSPETNLTFFVAPPAAGGPAGMTAVQSVQFTGPVKMTYCRPKVVADEAGRQTSVMTQMDADSDSANYDGVKQMAYLIGNVTMSLTDPTMYEAPALATGERVEINMKPRPGPEDLVFRISTPGGVSHFEATPLPKEEAKAK